MSPPSARPRTLLVGWDGAAPDLLFGMAARGELPTIASLLPRGAHGRLRSVFPPMTLPAWASLLTGVSPGEHGIFDFALPEPERRRLRFLDARDRRSPTLPARLSAAGLRVGTFLFPTTWPPSELSGGQISGFDSPVATSVGPEACRPPQLHAKIRRWLGGRDLHFADVAELHKGPGWSREAAVALLAGIEDKERVACALLAEGAPYDFFGILFGESDTAAHHFWHLHDPSSPRHDPEEARAHGGVLRAVYRRLDAALAAMLRADPGFDYVVLASDHGFGPASDRVLHLNSRLAEAGLLHFKRRGGGLGPLRRRVAGLLPPSVLDRVVRQVPREVVERLEFEARLGGVDFSRSLAYSEELDYAPSIRLNAALVPPDDRERVLTAIGAALSDWTDPVDGAPILRTSHRREDLHPGPCCERAPELYLELRCPGGASYQVLPSTPGGPSFERLPRADWPGAKGAGMAGTHRRDGVFVLAGPGVPVGPATMEIADLLPRWLEVSGLADLPTRSGPVSPEAPDSSSAAGLARRLRSLGYLP